MPAPVVLEEPKDQQSAEVTQSTPKSSLTCEGLGLGVGMMDQAVPFQCSDSGWPEELPTAQQSEGLPQVTPPRVLDGLTGVVIDQTVPFQCSAKEPLSDEPTAQQSEVSGQATAKSLLG